LVNEPHVLISQRAIILIAMMLGEYAIKF
jgi:hypothetical protein